MDEKESPRFINIKAAAGMLGVSPLTLRNWDKLRKLPAYRHPINNYRVYKLADIENFLKGIEDTNKPKKIRVEFLGDDAPDVKIDGSDNEGDELKI